DEGTTTDPTPSFSTMINFEFPNGHTYVPSPSDDQDYMLMEAVLPSLKDLEPKQPKEEEQPVSDSKSPVTNHIAPIKTDTTTRDSIARSSESPYGVKRNFNPIKYCAHYGMTCPSINVFGLKQTIVMCTISGVKADRTGGGSKGCHCLEDSVQHNSSIIQYSGTFLGAGMTFTFDVFIQIA
ncbi:hypothetical protein Tco_1038956, partial [Tanacetum coccineum]